MSPTDGDFFFAAFFFFFAGFDAFFFAAFFFFAIHALLSPTARNGLTIRSPEGLTENCDGSSVRHRLLPAPAGAR